MSGLWEPWRRLRSHRRDRRVATLGGRPFGEGPLPVERFAPSLDEAARVALIEGYVARLGPDGVDEATGHPLDNLINALADEWASEMRKQYAAYRSRASFRLGQAGAVAEQYKVLHAFDRYRLLQMELALESAVHRLGGQDPLDVREDGGE